MLRKRLRDDTLEDTEDSQPFILNMSGNKLTCADLLQIGPEKCGYVHKKSNSWSSFFLPCCYPKWRSRYLILMGNYLFRFESEHGQRPKGVPIPVDSINVKVLDDGIFVLETIRKNYYFRADSIAVAKVWADAIKSRKFMAIKENMGHAPVNPDVKKINSAGFKLFEDKLRADKVELDMSYNPLNSGI